MNFSKKVLLATLAGCIVLPASAAQKISDEQGVSGFFLLGLAAVNVESNTLANTHAGNIEVGDDTIDNLDDGPDSENAIMPLVNLSVVYTFENKATEIFFGNSIEDFLQFDFSTRLGVRHQAGDLGIFEFASQSTPIATEVWEDPYLTDVSRDDTERNADGFRFQWGNILGSKFDISYSMREIDIDKERSGDSLVANGDITAAEQELLDRNGDNNVLSLSYNTRFEDGGVLSVTGNSVDNDLDGDAMANDGYSLQVTYGALLDGGKRLVSNFQLGTYDFDKRNPIYDEKNSRDTASITMTLFVANAFGFKGWTSSTGFAYAQSDYDIDFYDTNVAMVNFGMLHQF